MIFLSIFKKPPRLNYFPKKHHKYYILIIIILIYRIMLFYVITYKIANTDILAICVINCLKLVKLFWKCIKINIIIIMVNMFNSEYLSYRIHVSRFFRSTLWWVIWRFPFFWILNKYKINIKVILKDKY